MDNRKMGCWFLAKATDNENNISYFVGANSKGLYRWNHESAEIELINSLDECEYDNEMYDVGVVVNGIVYFPPKNADKMLVYYEKSNKVEFVELYDEEIKKQINFRPFYFGHLVYKDCDDNIYIFYREYPIVTIIKKDRTQEVVSFDIDENIILEKIFSEKDGILYFPVSNANYVLSFNTHNKEFELLTFVNEDSLGVSSIICENDRLVMLSHNAKKIITYKFEDKSVEEFELPIADIDKEDLFQIKRQNDSYIIIPLLDIKGRERMKDILVLSQSFALEKSFSIDEKYASSKKWSVESTSDCEWYFLFDSVYYDDGDMFWPQNLRLVSLDYNTLNIDDINYPIPKNFDERAVSEKLISSQIELCRRNNYMLAENDRLGLNDFIEFYVMNEN